MYSVRFFKFKKINVLTNLCKLFIAFIILYCTHLSAQKDPKGIKDTSQILVDSTKIINIDKSEPLFNENRNSVRTNGDKCCPDLFYVD